MVIWGRFTNRYFILVPSSRHQFVSLKKCCTSIYTNDTETNQLKLAKPENCSKNAILPEAEYFSNVVLQITDGMENTGGLNMKLFGYLILAWILCFFMVCRGAKDRFENLWFKIFWFKNLNFKKSTGKAAYVTATFPIIILMILVIRGVTLPGAGIGLKYYLTPQWGTLVKAEAGFRIDAASCYLTGWAPTYQHHFENPTETWMAAAGQILFSYAVCQGSLTSLGSYNKWSFNSMKWTAKLREVQTLIPTQNLYASKCCVFPQRLIKTHFWNLVNLFNINKLKIV